jgi:hypothetical protein
MDGQRSGWNWDQRLQCLRGLLREQRVLLGRNKYKVKELGSLMGDRDWARGGEN